MIISLIAAVAQNRTIGKEKRPAMAAARRHELFYAHHHHHVLLGRKTTTPPSQVQSRFQQDEHRRSPGRRILRQPVA